MKTEQLIEAYKAEYLRTNGRTIEVTYHNGWFRVGNNTTKSRRAELISMTEVLRGRPTVTDRMESVNGVMTLVKASQHVVKNLLSGKDVIEDRDTPLCCSVASETYWSM